MIKISGQYNVFFDFLEAYSSVGYKGIDRHNPLILSLEEILNNNNQFLIIFDVLRMKPLFVSQGSLRLLGVKPEDLTSYHFKEATHPDDLKRQELGLVQLFKIAHELNGAKKGEMLLSSNFRMRIPNGNHITQLVRCYFFYSEVPDNAVYMINIKTDIDWYKKFKCGFHYYLGDDISNFRYPDHELLRLGHSFTAREFEIIKMIKAGHDSEQIAEKLFLSRHTINTHRKNILEKSGKAHMTDLILCLEGQGLL